MNKKIVITNAFVSRFGEDENMQAYFIEFDLMDDVIENVAKWDEFFKSISDGEPVMLIVER